MGKRTMPGLRSALAALVLALAMMAGPTLAEAGSRPSTAQLIRSSKVLKPGVYRLGGQRPVCGGARTVVSPKFWDYGGAISGYIFMNPSKIRRLPSYVRLFVYYHECGHQYYGRSEIQSDCYAVRQGMKQGWLNRKKVRRVCSVLFKNSRGDRDHPPGALRCRLLDQCYKGILVERPGRQQRRVYTIDAADRTR